MAKTRDIRMDAGTVAETTPDLSAKVARAIQDIRRPFMSFVEDFAALATSREELAPKFMKAFGLWQAETAGTFVLFVQHLDPTVGKSRNEYRAHRTYQAADYLRRLVGNARRTQPTAQERAAAPVSPVDALARVMASILNVIPENQHERLWNAMQQNLHWSERQVNRLQNQVEHVDPFVQIRGVRIENLRLQFPTVKPEAAQGANAASITAEDEDQDRTPLRRSA